MKKGIGNEYRINYESLTKRKYKNKTKEIDININNGYYDWINEL